MWIAISLVIFLCVILYIPNTVQICFHLKYSDEENKVVSIAGMNNAIKFKLFSIIPVKRKKILENKKKKKEKNKKKLDFKKVIMELLNKSKFKNLVLSLGINLSDCIWNSYINAFINTTICIYINSKQENFNMKKLYYATYVSEELFNVNFECIIKIRLVDTIKVILKEYMRCKKNKKQDSLVEKRSDIYGKASN